MEKPQRRGSRSRYEADYRRFRERLIAARDEAGLTQRQAAHRLGRSQSFVAKSESGERRVDVVEMVEFAKAYDKKAAFFLHGRRS